MEIIGHRGARGLAPENTLASIKKALEYHVDEVEIDVRVTKDSVVILNHNPSLFNHNDSASRISTHTYAELKKLKPDLATLEEAILIVNKTVPLRIEVKPHALTGPITKIVRDFLENGWNASDFRLASFSQTTLRELHRALPKIEKVVNEHYSIIKALFRAKALRATRIVIHQALITSGTIRYLSRRGYRTEPYPLNSPAKVARWEKCGLNSIVTDYPNRFEK